MHLTPERSEMFHDISSAHCHEIGQYGKRFPYIRFYSKAFADRVGKLLKNVRTAVDVGCGAGDKLLMLKDLKPSMDVYGIEYDPVMAKFASYITKGVATVIEGDALQQDYSGYDLIYMYWPIANAFLQCDLQARCMEQMKCGARLVVMSYQQTSDYPRFPDLHKGWVKSKRAYETWKLQDNAAPYFSQAQQVIDL